MIKLTVISDSQQTIHSFDSPQILIGSSSEASLTLEDPTLAPLHLEINQQVANGVTSYFINNLTNDPFVSLNHLPFGKHVIVDGDLIQLGETVLKIEIELSVVEQKEIPTPLPSPSKETYSNLEIEDLLRQVEALSTYTYPSTTEVGPSINLLNNQIVEEKEEEIITPSVEETQHLSMKEDYHYHTEFSEETELNPPQEIISDKIGQERKKWWQGALSFFGFFLSLIAISLGFTFVWLKDKSRNEEILAAKGVADIAIALTYSQINHLYPKNQNWTDPEFIKNNISFLVDPHLTIYSDFDSHGQFIHSPYMIRIYTNSDLSQFVVMAQPISNFMHWLMPKDSIIIDSRVMELRKTSDLKPLNRLLVNSNSTENANEISSFIQQGEIIPLASLITKKHNQGFLPPIALGLIHPKAENYIYNAPRYYLMGENFINKSVELYNKNDQSLDLSLFEQEAIKFAKFPYLILYTSQGIQEAFASQKALASLLPHEKFLIAYLQFDKNGGIANTHLMIDDNASDVVFVENHHELSLEKQAFNAVTDSKEKESDTEFLANIDVQGIDPKDPLYIELSKLLENRERALRPISNEMTDLLNKQTESSQNDFSSRFFYLTTTYLSASEEQNQIIFKELKKITNEHSHISLTHFLECIKAAELDCTFQDYLSALKNDQPPTQAAEEYIDNLLSKIQASASWNELAHDVSEIFQTLLFEHIPDERKMVTYQNLTRFQVIQKLNQFLLSNHPLSLESFTLENLPLVVNILDVSWLNDEDIYNFYLGEYLFRCSIYLHTKDFLVSQ